MTLEEVLKKIERNKEAIKAFGVKKLGVFGSVVRGEATEESDIDLVVEFSKRKSLLTVVALERQLSSALGRKVDVLTQAAISPYLRDRIMSDLRVIYEAR